MHHYHLMFWQQAGGHNVYTYFYHFHKYTPLSNQKAKPVQHKSPSTDPVVGCSFQTQLSGCRRPLSCSCWLQPALWRWLLWCCCDSQRGRYLTLGWRGCFPQDEILWPERSGTHSSYCYSRGPWRQITIHTAVCYALIIWVTSKVFLNSRSASLEAPWWPRRSFFSSGSSEWLLTV